ncbi:MAG TPA: hypothetical protein VES40_18575, partial [Ilumatobacteraceae bacterium]|nr:hypothetical protein [Ilumatobacteraceae bacterium]
MTATARRSAPLGRHREFERATADHRSGRGILLVGSHGSGRTTLARAVSDDVERNGRSPLWLTATRALQPIAFGIFASLLPRDALTSPAERMTAVLSALRFHGG